MSDVVRLAYRRWRDHRTVRLGAALAYYGLFAIVPLLTVTIVVADLLVPYDAVVTFVARPLAELLGSDVDAVAGALTDRLADARATAGAGLIGLTTLLVSASLLFVAFQDALNAIWEVPYRSGLRTTVQRRLLAFAVVFVAVGVVLASLAVQAVVGWLGDLVPSRYARIAATTELVSYVAPVLVTAVALALLYALLPLAEVDARAAGVGGGVTVVVMAGGLVATNWVLRRAASVSLQGAAGSVLVLLTGLYVQGQIVLGGAECVRVLTERWGPDARAGPEPGSGQRALRRVPRG